MPICLSHIKAAYLLMIFDGKTKVSNLATPIAVQEYVVRLDVEMQNVMAVQELKTLHQMTTSRVRVSYRLYGFGLRRMPQCLHFALGTFLRTISSNAFLSMQVLDEGHVLSIDIPGISLRPSAICAPPPAAHPHLPSTHREFLQRNT